MKIDDSDHYMVKAKIRERITNVKNVFTKRKQWNVDNIINNPQIRKECQEELKKRNEQDSTVGEQVDVNEHWGRVKTLITETAELKIGERTRFKYKEWFDEECMNAIKAKNDAGKTMIQRETRINYETYREKRGVANKICRRKKKDWLKEQLLEINSLQRQNKRRKLYKAMSFQTKTFQPKINGCRSKVGRLLGEEKLVMERWREYFRDL